MEMEEKIKLTNDLKEKLERLQWTLKQPGLFIAEYFTSIRNEIDLETERLIEAFQNGNEFNNDDFESEDESWSKDDIDYWAKRINKAESIRTRFIQFLDKMEANLYEKLKDSSLNSTSDSFNKLEKRIKEFSTSMKFKDSNEIEEVYLKLALDIIDATNETERHLFNNQTIAYLSIEKKGRIGCLVYLSKDFLNRDELNCSKIPYKLSFCCIHESILASLNSSLAVGISRPFVLTRKILILANLIMIIHLSTESSSGKVVYLEGSSKPNFNLSFDDRMLYKEATMTFDKMDLTHNSFDAVDLKDIYFDNIYPFGYVIIRSNDNRLRRFEIADSIIEIINSINLSENQLEALDDQQLAKASKLSCLNLVNAVLPDTRFSLGFLATLANLNELYLTLPNAPIDFGVFQNLTNMTELGLHSATSLDSSIERYKLTKEHFKQLSIMTRLRKLCLYHFKIESLQKEMLSEFDELSDLVLADNDISRIEEGAFEHGSRGPHYVIELTKNSIHSINAKIFQDLSPSYLGLSYNRIEQLPPGVFAELTSIQTLHLHYNSIRCIMRGVFNNLSNLIVLKLDDNLIESIDPHSFEGCTKTRSLSLAYNKLKSIDHNEFFNLFSEKKSVFWQLSSLEDLSLKGNQLEMVDLNCFESLTRLIHLDLSDNQIKALNKRIRPGVLSQLNILDLSNNKLTRISQHAFSQSTDLATIKLSGNKLQTFDANFFEPFVQLRVVELQDNALSIDITANTFARCSNIAAINLLGNPSVRIQDGAFSELNNLGFIRLQDIQRFLEHKDNRPFLANIGYLSLFNSSIESLDAFKLENRSLYLRWLDLSGNRIRTISHDDLTAMPDLTQLNLANNLIEILDDVNLFENLKDLENLNLSGNKLKHIHCQLFKSLHKLQKLDLSNNPTPLNLDSGIFRGLFNLKQINLAGNNIASFDLASLFRSCRLLESLDLSNNQLDHESVNEASMSGSTAQNLKELMLANNRLENIYFIRHLYRIERLDLSGNKIESMTVNGVNIFSRLVKLKHVNLSINQINSLEIKTIFSHLKYQLEFLDLSNNPFNLNKKCQCTRNCYSFIENS